MTPDTFIEHFATFAAAPNGVAKLRELILQLAVQGQLVPQDVNDQPASVLNHEYARVSEFITEWKSRVPARLVPTESKDRVSRRAPSCFVPQGHPTIAQRFIAGRRADKRTSPAGTKESSRPTRRSIIPSHLSSLRDFAARRGIVDPAINRWAIGGQSLAGRGAPRP